MSGHTWRDEAVEHVDALHAIACKPSNGVTPDEWRIMTRACTRWRKWLCEDGVDRPDAAHAIAERIAAKDAEIERLRAAVKAAYMEGRRCFWDPDNAPKNWRDSDARKALGGEA